MHGLVYQRNKIDWSSECYNIKCPGHKCYKGRKENHKNYLGREHLGREPSNFEYKETMIHKIFVYNILWMKLQNQESFFF